MSALGAWADPAAAAPPASAAAPAVAPLPREHITMVYRNGDLDSVVFYVKQGRNRPVFMDRSDSLTAFRYLGVIYAADDAMRERGRYYFNQLLLLNPHATVTDLLPGEKARAVFKEVREEFFELHPELAAAAAAAPAPAPAPVSTGDREKPAVAKSHHGHAWWWVAGGVAVAGAATAAAVIMLEPEPEVYTLHD